MTVLSPCTGVCAIDPATATCLGCRRTLAEIAEWLQLSDDEKRTVLEQLSAREAASAQD